MLKFWAKKKRCSRCRHHRSWCSAVLLRSKGSIIDVDFFCALYSASSRKLIISTIFHHPLFLIPHSSIIISHFWFIISHASLLMHDSKFLILLNSSGKVIYLIWGIDLPSQKNWFILSGELMYPLRGTFFENLIYSFRGIDLLSRGIDILSRWNWCTLLGKFIQSL